MTENIMTMSNGKLTQSCATYLSLSISAIQENRDKLQELDSVAQFHQSRVTVNEEKKRKEKEKLDIINSELKNKEEQAEAICQRPRNIADRDTELAAIKQLKENKDSMVDINRCPRFKEFI